MNRMKARLASLAAIGVIAMPMVAPAVPVFAATKYEAVSAVATPANGTKAEFNKYLTMKSAANVPNVTFNFSVAPGAHVDADRANKKSEVLAGIGTPTIAEVPFTAADAKYDAVQDGDTGITLEAGQSYAKHLASIDFTGIEFDEPGVYRYVITESATDAATGVTNDAEAKRTLDVYVTDDGTGKLEVSSYVLQNGEVTDGAPIDQAEVTKSAGYVNTYATNDLEFSKKVSGNQASRDQYFKFTVKITGAVKGTKYDLDMTNADAAPVANAATTYTAEEMKTANSVTDLTAGEDGTLEHTFYIQNGQSIKIKGLANGTAYEVSEENLDYTAAAKIADGGDTEGVTGATADIDATKLTNVVKDAGLTKDTSVEFTNSKEGTIPTGVILAMAPYLVGAGIAGCGGTIYVVSKKKNKKDKLSLMHI